MQLLSVSMVVVRSVYFAPFALAAMRRSLYPITTLKTDFKSGSFNTSSAALNKSILCSPYP